MRVLQLRPAQDDALVRGAIKGCLGAAHVSTCGRKAAHRRQHAGQLYISSLSSLNKFVPTTVITLCAAVLMHVQGIVLPEDHGNQLMNNGVLGHGVRTPNIYVDLKV